MLITSIVLAGLGLAFGSFITALTWRVHQQARHKKSKKSLSIISGRSQCPNCGHTLAARDLVPVFSWLIQRGKCRFCGKNISWQYPAVELATSAVFVISYIFWPGGVDSSGNLLLFVTWIITSVGLMALLVYDARWMLLTSRILYPTFFIAAAGRLAYIVSFENNKLRALLLWLASVAVASGIFWALFTVSQGKWIGYGDVRLGLITGTILASPSKSFLMILVASVLGTLFALPGLLGGNKTISSKLPFGPFLIAATAVVLLIGNPFIDWYKGIFLP